MEIIYQEAQRNGSKKKWCISYSNDNGYQLTDDNSNRSLWVDIENFNKNWKIV